MLKGHTFRFFEDFQGQGMAELSFFTEERVSEGHNFHNFTLSKRTVRFERNENRNFNASTSWSNAESHFFENIFHAMGFYEKYFAKVQFKWSTKTLL